MTRLTIDTQKERKFIKNEMIAFLRKPTKRELKPGGKLQFVFDKQIIGETTIKNLLPITITSKEIILNGIHLDDLSLDKLVKTLGFSDKNSLISFYCSPAHTPELQYIKWNAFTLPCPFCEKIPEIVLEKKWVSLPYTEDDLKKTPLQYRCKNGSSTREIVGIQYLCPCGLSHRSSGGENLDYRAAQKWNTIVELIQSGLSRNIDFSSGELNGELN